MVNRSLQIILACLAVISASSCEKEEGTAAKNAEFSVVSSILAVKSPALDETGAGNFQKGDVNALFFQNADRKKIGEFKYTYGDTYYWSDLQLPQDTKELSVSACYPAVTADDPAAFLWDGDRESDFDLLLAPPAAAVKGSETPVKLSFVHAMHKLVIKVVPDGTTTDENSLKALSMELGPFQYAATVDLLQGTVTGTSGASRTMQLDKTENAVILPPQSVEGMTLTVSLAGTQKTFRLSDCQVNGQPLTRLESGKSFVLTVKASSAGFSISGQEIAGWENQGEIEDHIII